MNEIPMKRRVAGGKAQRACLAKAWRSVGVQRRAGRRERPLDGVSGGEEGMGVKQELRRRSAPSKAPAQLHDAAECFGADRRAVKQLHCSISPAVNAIATAHAHIKAVSDELDKEANRLGIEQVSPSPLAATQASLLALQSALSSASEQMLSLKTEARDIKNSIKQTAFLQNELEHYSGKLRKLDPASTKRESNQSKHDRTKASFETNCNATAKQIRFYSQRQRVETELTLATLFAAEAESAHSACSSLSHLPNYLPEWLERASHSSSAVAQWLRRAAPSMSSGTTLTPSASTAAAALHAHSRSAPPKAAVANSGTHLRASNPAAATDEGNTQMLYAPSEHRSANAPDGYTHEDAAGFSSSTTAAAHTADAHAAMYQQHQHGFSGEEVDRLRQKIASLESRLQEKERECEGLRKAKQEVEEQAERRKNENTELQRRLRQERERMGREMAALKSQVRDATEIANKSKVPASPQHAQGSISRNTSLTSQPATAQQAASPLKQESELRLQQSARSNEKSQVQHAKAEQPSNQQAAVESDEDEEELDELTAL